MDKSYLQALSELGHFASCDFTEYNVPNLTGRVAIVTGGSSGCGYMITKALLLHNARVYIAARSRNTALAAIEDLKLELHPSIQVFFIPLDLVDPESIKSFVAEFLSKESRLDFLFNNAGIVPSGVTRTPYGVETSFAINVIGSYILTEKLLEVLRKTAKLDQSKFAVKLGPRIVFTTSSVQFMAPDDLIPLNDMDSLASGKYSAQDLYNISKAGDAVLGAYYGRILKKDEIIASSAHPGAIRSSLGREMSYITQVIVKYLCLPQRYGAINALYAAVSPNVEGGEYITCFAKIGVPRKQVLDVEFQDKLIDYCRDEAVRMKAL